MNSEIKNKLIDSEVYRSECLKLRVQKANLEASLSSSKKMIKSLEQEISNIQSDLMKSLNKHLEAEKKAEIVEMKDKLISEMKIKIESLESQLESKNAFNNKKNNSISFEGSSSPSLHNHQRIVINLTGKDHLKPSQFSKSPKESPLKKYITPKKIKNIWQKLRISTRQQDPSDNNTKIVDNNLSHNNLTHTNTMMKQTLQNLDFKNEMTNDSNYLVGPTTVMSTNTIISDFPKLFDFSSRDRRIDK